MAMASNSPFDPSVVTGATKVNFEHLLWSMMFTPMGEHALYIDDDDLPCIDWGARPYLRGAPGGGKTSVMNALARACGLHLVPMDSSWGEVALGNLPVPDMKKMVVRFLAGDWIDELNDGGIWFIDDATTFPPSMQTMLLGGLHGKRVGSKYLVPRCRVAMAANDPKDAPAGFRLAPAVANRPCHIEWPDKSVEWWANEFIGDAGLVGVEARRRKHDRKVATGDGDDENWSFPNRDAEEEEARVLRLWDDAWRESAALVAHFSMLRKAEPKMHRNQPPPSDPKSGEAWLSPRTKEYAVRALCSAKVHGLDRPTMRAFIAGYVGDEWTREFLAWLPMQDLPDAAQVLDGKETFTHDRNRPDRTAVFVRNAVAMVTAPDAENQHARTTRLWDVLNDLSADCLDTVAMVVQRKLWKAGLVRGYPASGVVLGKLAPFFKLTEVKANLGAGAR